MLGTICGDIRVQGITEWYNVNHHVIAVFILLGLRIPHSAYSVTDVNASTVAHSSLTVKIHSQESHGGPVL